MIKSVLFRFGTSPNAEPLRVSLSSITVFVGPNNAGKSRALVELESLCRTMTLQSSNVILADAEITPIPREKMERELEALTVEPAPGENIQPNYVLLARLHPQTQESTRMQIPRPHVLAEAEHARLNSAPFFAQFLSLYTMRLDGASRLSLLAERPAGDLVTTASNHLAHLFIDNDLRSRVRDVVHGAFGKYFVIDPTKIGSLRVRLSERAPSSEREEKGWESASVEFHKASPEIKQASDGVKAFTGIVTAVIAGAPRITLIDEPEAFLHPGLAGRLGRELGRHLAGSDRRLFVSTHSAQFLMGCIQSGAPLSIVRLTYNYSAPTARLLPQDKLLHLMRHPLLRSTGVLNGLFYEAVIVTESDSDRAFYQEVNERLLLSGDKRGISNVLFLNAQNKQTVWDIVRPLRELGIPAAGVVDIDVVKEGGQVWNKPLEGAFVPPLNHTALQSQRQALLRSFEQSGKNMKRDGGVAILDDSDREACNNLFDTLASYGVFVVRGGELESWFKHLGASGHGSSWLIDLFEKLGEDPDDTNYVRPGVGDAWDFLGAIHAWISDPKRKGIPR